MINRRSLITGLISFVAAPAVVRVDSLMKLPAPKRLLTVEEIIEAILNPLAEKYAKLYVDAIIYGSSYGKFGNGLDYPTYNSLCLQDVYIDYSKTDSR